MPNRDEIELASGRILLANRGIVGINELLEVYGGYDDRLTLDVKGLPWADPLLTLEERQEIAQHMIKLWTAWAEKQHGVE